MPRANRYSVPGYAYHLTHRCHNRSFLLRFAKDRWVYRERLRVALQAFSTSLLTWR
jgi:putative transposase